MAIFKANQKIGTS